MGCFFSTHRLMVLCICTKFHEEICYSFQDEERTRNDAFELQPFKCDLDLCRTLLKHDFYICIRKCFYICTYYFHKEICNSFKDKEGPIADMNDLKKKNRKEHNSGKTEVGLWFFFSAHHLMLLYICTKFHE